VRQHLKSARTIGLTVRTVNHGLPTRSTAIVTADGTSVMNLEIFWTVSAIVVALAVAGWMIVLERREPVPGQPRVFPTTPVLFLAVIAIVLALAHLMTLVTGTPHMGRLGWNCGFVEFVRHG
jgi:hypothetical protein